VSGRQQGQGGWRQRLHARPRADSKEAAEIRSLAFTRHLDAAPPAAPPHCPILPPPRSMDAGAFRPDFVFFNHRGKALPIHLPSSL
jgi:hypothetical protein